MNIFEPYHWMRGLFYDPDVAELLSGAQSLRDMLSVELAHTKALQSCGLVSDSEMAAVEAAIAGFEPDAGVLADGAMRDGVVVPSLVAELRKSLPDEVRGAVHTGLTSQDVIDTATVLMLKQALALFEDRLAAIIDQLEALEGTFGTELLMGRTRMQAAMQVTAGDRIGQWRRPVEAAGSDVETLRDEALCLQLGGAVGDRAAWGENAGRVAAHMGASLGLSVPGTAWHSDRARMVKVAEWLSRTTGALGKVGQDIALMAQQGVDEITLEGGGGSSAMPHKQNPVQAELLVTLARFNATQLSGMHHALVHEQERSGAAWTLEWMLLPQMVMATGKALSMTTGLLSQVRRMGSR